MVAGQKIYAALRAHPGYKVTNADRMCASSATLIFMAGDFRTCAANTKFLIHAPEIPAEKGRRWTAAKHSNAAGLLKRLSAELVKTYAERTGLPARLFEQEVQHENIMGVSRARELGWCIAWLVMNAGSAGAPIIFLIGLLP
jgi:ATP-dependent protease ClpP protease subunit